MPSNVIKAAKIWTLLVCAARNNQILTYETIGNWVDGDARNELSALNIREPLGIIKRYCRANDYYALTAIVVNKNTGIPGKGIDDALDISEDTPEVIKLQKYAAEKMFVLAFDWMHEIPPTVEALENIVNTYP